MLVKVPRLKQRDRGVILNSITVMSNYKRITLNQKRLITSLQIKKYRKQEQCFLVEGAKSVQELVSSDFEVRLIAGTADFLAGGKWGNIDVLEVSEKELESLGEFQSNNGAVAVAKMKANEALTIGADEFAIMLDDIRDPGNLGTIIRTADWYGINKIIASNETADFYNSKVITSTMGSFTRVKLYYTDLEDYLASNKQRVFGAYLDGKSVYSADFGKGGIILIGSESHGISPKLEKIVSDKITIPRVGKAESLNAGIATAIILDNLRRK
jgi:TrmH family RNA methyltransferase